MSARTAARPETDIPRLLQDFEGGKRAGLARVISRVENEEPGFRDLLKALQPRLGRAHRIGLTGPPGAGKSTLSSALVKHFRAGGEKVAVVAVDPSSPYTGGALLGDRIRMNELALDPGVFIRSMATRGSLGGLALATKEVTDVLDAFGFDRILIETVGVGQSELDIACAADSTVVLVVPESGDAIQTMKAGLMEASDLFVVNKADRPGAERMARELSMMLHLRLGQALRNVPAHHGVDPKRAGSRAKPAEPLKEEGWQIPVLQTVAHEGGGVTELAEALDRHRAWLGASGEYEKRRAARLRERVREEVDRRLRQRTWKEAQGEARLRDAAPALESGEVSPYDVAEEIVAAVMKADWSEPG
jgi:LAO/AO transport system kinase